MEVLFEIGNHYEHLNKPVISKKDSKQTVDRWTAFIRLKSEKPELIAALVDYVFFDIGKIMPKTTNLDGIEQKISP